MSFTDKDDFVCINFQKIDKYMKRDIDDKDKIYIVWDLEENKIIESRDLLRDLKFSKMNFPNHINGLYRFYDNNLEGGKQNKGERASSENIQVTAMQFFGDALFIGTAKGDINIVKDTCLQVNGDMVVESLKPNNY